MLTAIPPAKVTDPVVWFVASVASVKVALAKVAPVPEIFPANNPADNVFSAGLTVNPIPTVLAVKATPDPDDLLENTK